MKEATACGMRGAGCGVREHACGRRPAAWSLKPVRGQASLESTVAMVFGLLLLLAFMNVFFHFGERQVRRQLYYECTRGLAGRQRPMDAIHEGPIWDKVYAGCTDPRHSGPLELLVRDGNP